MLLSLRSILTLAVGAVGGLIASWLGFPSPWLLGAMIAVMMLGALGFPVSIPPMSSTLISWFLGISLASGIESDISHHMLEWANSLLIMAAMLGVSLVALFTFYSRFCHWERAEALMAAVPGNLNIVLIFAAERGIEVKRVAMVHTLRIFSIVATLPLFFPILDRVSISTSHTSATPHELALVLIASALGGFLGQRFKLPAGMLLGSLATTLLLKFSLGIHVYISPDWFHLLMIALGTLSAVRATGINLNLLMRTLKAGIGGVALTLVISGLFSAVLYLTTDISLLQALLSYLPGGIEVAIAIAFSANVDPIFVATHQVLRVVFMSLLFPLVYQWLLVNRG